MSKKLRWTPHTILAGLALLTFVFSLSGIAPAALVERAYSRTLFPAVSQSLQFLSDSLPLAWLDVQIVLAVLIVGLAIVRRQWRYVTTAAAVGYLFFFWSWGLNYHRVRPAAKVDFEAAATTPEAMQAFARAAVSEINSLYELANSAGYVEEEIRAGTVARVRRVTERLDGVDWNAPSRVKTSLLVNPWFRMAGIDGLFNPLAHEPIINNRLLEFEKPFIIAHELAHVRGYPNEGDANFVAILATVMSEDLRLRYSGWLYLRTPELDRRLDPGPQHDLREMAERLRGDRVQMVSNVQGAVLDLYLKANRDDQGIRSYAQVAILAAGTRSSWERFR